MSYIYKRPNINSNSREFSSKIYSNVPASIEVLDSSLSIYNNVSASSTQELLTVLNNNTGYSLSRGCNVWPFKYATKSTYSSLYRNNARDIFFNNMPYYIAKFLYFDIVNDPSSFATYKGTYSQATEIITSFAFSLSTETYIPTTHEDAIDKAEDALTNFKNYFLFQNTRIFDRIFKTNDVTFTFTLSKYTYIKTGTACATYDYYGILTDSTHKDEVAPGITYYVY